MTTKTCSSLKSQYIPIFTNDKDYKQSSATGYVSQINYHFDGNGSTQKISALTWVDSGPAIWEVQIKCNGATGTDNTYISGINIR